jgi:L-iditol 2-dehydrogenase
MRAIAKVSPGVGHVEVVDWLRPEPGPNDVLLEVVGAGVCGTDLHIEDGEVPSRPPVVLGHEVSGTVVGVGADVDSAWLGARVVAHNTWDTCGRCALCTSGRPQLCDQRRSIGSRVDGAFASHVVVPAGNLFRIPDWLDQHAAALHEPLACVCHGLCDPSAVDPGDRVLVVGPGPIGLLAAQVAAAGGGQVTVAGLPQDAGRLAVASELGLATLSVDRLADGEAATFGFDVVVECSGSAGGLALCLTAVRKAGRYVQLGVFGHPVTVPVDLVFQKELSVRPRFSSDAASWRRALELVATRSVQLAPLISDICDVEDWPQISDRLRRGDAVKIVIDPRPHR